MFWYLASPYSKYPEGTQAAFEMACWQAGLLIRAGVPVFSPIAHSHPHIRVRRNRSAIARYMAPPPTNRSWMRHAVASS